MTDIEIVVNSLEARQAERDQLIRQLAMWAQVKAQGIDPDAVDRFGFDSALLTLEQRIAIRRAARLRQPDPFSGRVERHGDYGISMSHYYSDNKRDNGHFISPVYNYVVLKNGTGVTLDPPIKAS